MRLRRALPSCRAWHAVGFLVHAKAPAGAVRSSLVRPSGNVRTPTMGQSRTARGARCWNGPSAARRRAGDQGVCTTSRRGGGRRRGPDAGRRRHGDAGMSDPELFKYDVRVRRRMVEAEQISEEEVARRLEALPDLADECEELALRQPALTQTERNQDAGASPRPPEASSPVPLAAPPPSPAELAASVVADRGSAPLAPPASDAAAPGTELSTGGGGARAEAPASDQQPRVGTAPDVKGPAGAMAAPLQVEGAGPAPWAAPSGQEPAPAAEAPPGVEQPAAAHEAPSASADESPPSVVAIPQVVIGPPLKPQPAAAGGGTNEAGGGEPVPEPAVSSASDADEGAESAAQPAPSPPGDESPTPAGDDGP
jgi:hypothetical protein